jgi:DNA invertase Pin-like site-specific DNA recombinase
MDGKFIAYYRQSTQKQAISGLGIDAQIRAVKEHLNGGSWQLLGEYTETESGRKNDRPQLEAALKACKKEGATLIVAKLDRLSRDAHFLLGLQKAKVDFICCDMPTANRLTLGIMALIAEEEARMISARTKAAMQSAKERGIIIGAHGKVLAAEHKQAAVTFAKTLAPAVAELKQAGVTTIRGIAAALNSQGIKTATGGAWHNYSVQLLLKRINANV